MSLCIGLLSATAHAETLSPHASGGEVTFAGATQDAVHSFTNVGENVFTLFAEKEVWFLVVGGGGAGGKDCSGGGGAGGFVESNSVVLAAGTYMVTVGAGGAVTSSGRGGNGGASAISLGGVDIARAIGGGGGGGWSATSGAAGGSGGGSTNNGNPGAGTEGQGYAGGKGSSRATAGGGGAGGPGLNSSAVNGPGSAGGPGKASDITGEEIYYAGGGGGGGFNSTATLINGGIGGGGNGARYVDIATRKATTLPDGRNEYEAEAGVNGLGGGGGGANNKEQVGRPGGSGVVIIRIAGNPDSVLQVLSTPEGIGSPSPAYGSVTDLAAGDTRVVSCGATVVTNAAGTIVYSCTGWKLYDKDDNLLSSGPETYFTYTHPTPAAFRKLEWQWDPTFSGTVAAGPGGSVSPSGTAWYSSGTPATVTATPDSGMDFIRWTGTLPAGIDATSASVTFTPAEPFEMTALFGTEYYVATYAPNGDAVYTFNASGPFTLERPANARLLLVGGGGAGGTDCAGGGGAGGMVEVPEILLDSGTYTITVGAGGQPSNSNSSKGGSGGNSALSFGGTALYTAIGGGGGGSWQNTSGESGGSGGGGTSTKNGGSGVEGQGNAGGSTTGNNKPSGGGGAGAAGGVSNGSVAGAGGIGRMSDITGEEIYYAGGGGGGGYGITPGAGGLGGGGNGVRNVAVATRQAATLSNGRNEYEAECGVDGLGGGGGGGNNTDYKGRPGGRGVVIVRVQATGGDALYVSSSTGENVSSPSPAYGLVTGLAAGETRAVSCGAMSVTNAAGTVVTSCTGWKLYDADGNAVSNGTETSFTYTHPDPAEYRKLEWQWSKSVSGTIAAGPGGSVSTSGTAWYDGSASVSVTATPNSGMSFIRWGGTLPEGIDPTSASVTFTPEEPFEITALFGTWSDQNLETFTPDGDIAYTLNVSGTFTLDWPASARILLVGGGGAGGNTMGGGGGGGGVVEVANASLAAGTYTVTVGAGGAPGSGQGQGGDGEDSALSLGDTALYTAIGGGGGGGWSTKTGSSGASGGGGSNGGSGGTGTTGQGFAGAKSGGSNSTSGGGGGAGHAGYLAVNARAGNGGEGVPSDISGAAIIYGGGGGAGGSSSGFNLYDAGFGGVGGGGAGGKSTAGSKGTDGLGGGGGGGGWNGSDKAGGAGGKGVVIIRVSATPPADVLTVTSSAGENLSSPSPAYGSQTGLSAGQEIAVSCGATVATNAAGTVQYTCAGWKLYDVDGNAVSNGTETSFTYVHPSPAAFRKLEWQWETSAWRGAIAAAPGGTVSPSGTNMFAVATPVTITATPDAGNVFVRWTGSLPAGASDSSASVTFTPTAPFDMTAVFGAGFHVAMPAPDGIGSDETGDGSASAPFATISNALEKANAAIAGGMAEAVKVSVAAGTYAESGLVLSNAIVVAGAGASATTVNGNGGYRVFTLTSQGAALKNLSVTGGRFTANSQSGAGVYMTAGLVEDCVIDQCGNSDKTGLLGGGIYASGGRISRTVFTRCVVRAIDGSDGSGSALYLANGAVCENSLFTNNVAGSYGSNKGGTVNLRNAGTALVNCTVVRNQNSGDGREMAYTGIVQSDNAKVVNCVAYENGRHSGSTYRDVYGAANCFVHSAWGLSRDDALVSHVALDDLSFADYAGGDYRPGSTALVNAGTDTAAYADAGALSSTDLDGNARLSGAALDIGCYEKDLSSVTAFGSADSYGALVGTNATFSATALGGSGSYLYRWDFGDGTAAQTTSDADIAHAFAAAGRYHVTVAASDDGGATWGPASPLAFDILAAPSTMYVDVANESPEFPYDTPAKASATIAAALGCLTNQFGVTIIDGVTIHVASGTYDEKMLRLSSAVSIVGAGSATNAEDSVILQPANLAGNNTAYAVRLEHEGAILENVKVRVGARTGNNNGWNVYLASGTVRGCWIAGNGEAQDNLYMTGGLVEDTKISDGNRVNWENPGIGINVYATGGRIRRCLVTGGVGGNSVNLSGTAVMENSLVTKTTNYSYNKGQNWAWAVVLSGTAQLVNCTVAGNTSFYQASNGGAKTPDNGGVKVTAATASVVNCAIYGNDCSKTALEWGNANAARFFSCAVPETAAAGLTNAVENGNIVVADPDFASIAADLFQPSAGSRLIDAGADLASYGEFSATDLDGNARRSPVSAPVDIGCYEADQSSLSCGFTVSAETALNGVGVVFTPAVYGVGSAEITCRWDFDDGGSEVVAPLAPHTHAFSTAKMHTVTLSVSTDGGSTWIASHTHVSPILTAPAQIWVDGANASGAAHPYATEATAATSLADAMGMLTNTLSAGATVLDGVTIHVKPGIYSEYGFILGSAVTILGEGGDRTAVAFNAGRLGYAFYLKHAGATLSGITVSNGMSRTNSPYGGNVSMTGGTVTNCVVAGGRTLNNDYSRGLNVHMMGGLVADSLITGGAWTDAWHPCSGLNVYMAGGRVVRCVISGARGCSTGNGAEAVSMAGGVIENCLLTDNKVTSGAIYLNAASARAVNCTVVANSSSGTLYGNGVICNNGSAKVVNCAIYDNGGTAALEWGNKNAACFYNCAFSADAAFTGANSTVKDLTDAAFKNFVRGDYKRGDYAPRSKGALADVGSNENYAACDAISETDLAGKPRVVRKVIDIGCYENQAQPASVVILQ